MSLVEAERDLDTEDVIEQRWQGVLDSFISKRPYGLAPWSPVPGEPRIAQLAFGSYRDSAQRDLAVTANTMAMKYSDIRDLARLYCWQQRAEMYDQWAERQGDDARAELMARTQLDTAAAMSRLPALAASAFQLVEGAVNAKLAAQADRVRDSHTYNPDSGDEEDEDLKPISITQAIRIGEMTRSLLDATTRFLGVKIVLEHNVSGHIDHGFAATEQDAIGFLTGLSDAGFPIDVPAVEITDGR